VREFLNAVVCNEVSKFVIWGEGLSVNWNLFERKSLGSFQASVTGDYIARLGGDRDWMPPALMLDHSG
jgi:hypothetical protein